VLALSEHPARLQEIATVDFERVGDSIDVVEGDVSLTPLDLAEVGTIKSCRVSQRLLTQIEFESQLTDSLTEGFTLRELLCGRGGHTPTVRE
jgi:hypothetical protein